MYYLRNLTKSNAKGLFTKALYHISVISATQILQKSTILHFAHTLAYFPVSSGDIDKTHISYLVIFPVDDKNTIQFGKCYILRFPVDHIRIYDFTVIRDMIIPESVLTRNRIESVNNLSWQYAEILLLLIYDPALQCQRKFPDTGG